MSEPSTEEQRVRSLDDRFGKIEGEQERQGGLLDQILGKLGGGKPDSDETVTSADAPSVASPGEMAEQMRQAVRDVRAEEAAEAARQQHDADHARLAAPPAEQTPREVMVKGKQRLQEIMFGKTS